MTVLPYAKQALPLNQKRFRQIDNEQHNSHSDPRTGYFRNLYHYQLKIALSTPATQCKILVCQCNVYGKKSFLREESDTLRSYRVYISPTMYASSALIEIESICHVDCQIHQRNHLNLLFQLVPFQMKADQRYPIFHWSWNFWEIFSVILFLKNFSRMKRWWWEELQLPVTTFDAVWSKFFAKVIWYFKSFSLNEYDLRIVLSVFLIEILDLLSRAEIREKLFLNHYRKSVQNSEVAGHVWVELKL